MAVVFVLCKIMIVNDSDVLFVNISGVDRLVRQGVYTAAFPLHEVSLPSCLDRPKLRLVVDLHILPSVCLKVTDIGLHFSLNRNFASPQKQLLGNLPTNFYGIMSLNFVDFQF